MSWRNPGSPLGVSWWVVVALATLAVPRILVHDLAGSVAPALQWLLAVGPPALWVVVAVRARVPSPVLTLVTVGSLYGLALAVVHNLLWDQVFDEGPRLGGALTGELSTDAEEALLRTAAALSSLFTGMVLGLLAGLLAAVVLARAGRTGTRS